MKGYFNPKLVFEEVEYDSEEEEEIEKEFLELISQVSEAVEDDDDL